MAEPSRVAESDGAADLRDRADMLALAGDFERAVPLYREPTTANPKDAALRRKLAGGLDATGAGEEAIACYRSVSKGSTCLMRT